MPEALEPLSGRGEQLRRRLLKKHVIRLDILARKEDPKDAQFLQISKAADYKSANSLVTPVCFYVIYWFLA